MEEERKDKMRKILSFPLSSLNRLSECPACAPCFQALSPVINILSQEPQRSSSGHFPCNGQILEQNSRSPAVVA